MKTTPAKILHLKPNQIFVFGSNYGGRHGKGAALTAVKKFGAINGQGVGLQGQSYGIATKDRHLKVLPLYQIEAQVQAFLKFARLRSELEFLVTPIGCGLAGYKPEQIAPMFVNKTDNVRVPTSFATVLYYMEKENEKKAR